MTVPTPFFDGFLNFSHLIRRSGPRPLAGCCTPGPGASPANMFLIGSRVRALRLREGTFWDPSGIRSFLTLVPNSPRQKKGAQRGGQVLPVLSRWHHGLGLYKRKTGLKVGASESKLGSWRFWTVKSLTEPSKRLKRV
jgi:hypothetical protein